MISSTCKTLRNGEPPFTVFIVGESKLSSKIPTSSGAGSFSTLSFLFFLGVFSASSLSEPNDVRLVKLVRLESVGDSRLLVPADGGDLAVSSSESPSGVDERLLTSLLPSPGHPPRPAASQVAHKHSQLSSPK